MEIVFKQSYSGTWFVDTLPNEYLKKERISITKLLGGKQIIHQKKWFCYHGYGGYVTEWFFSEADRPKVEEALKNVDLKIKWLKNSQN